MPEDTKRAAHQVVVDGATMVHGPGHLTEEQSAQWVAIYRRINPELLFIHTENFYR